MTFKYQSQSRINFSSPFPKGRRREKKIRRCDFHIVEIISYFYVIEILPFLDVSPFPPLFDLFFAIESSSVEGYERERERERSSGSLHPNLDRRRSDVSATDRKVGTGRVYFRAPDILYLCSLSLSLLLHRERRRGEERKIYVQKVGFIASIYRNRLSPVRQQPDKKREKKFLSMT